MMQYANLTKAEFDEFFLLTARLTGYLCRAKRGRSTLTTEEICDVRKQLVRIARQCLDLDITFDNLPAYNETIKWPY